MIRPATRTRARSAPPAAVLAAAIAAAIAPTAAAQWTHAAGDPARTSTALSALPSFAAPAWVRAADAAGNTITFLPQAALVCDADRVYALGRVSPPSQPANQWKLFAISRVTGGVDWAMAVTPPVLESTSAPAVDARRAEVIVATGSQIRSIRAADGVVQWTTSLALSVVNASPLVTTDLAAPDGTPRDRVLITDFDGFGTGATLYCLNTSDYHAASNPYVPGQIVWTAPIGGASGATPAYLAPLGGGGGGGGQVYVATVGDVEEATGRVFAFNIDQPIPGQVTPAWTTVNPAGHGFFGGLTVRTTAAGPMVFAASYSFSGDANSANLLKLDAITGQVVWSAPANRTNSIPVVLDDGTIVLSAGINGYGSLRNISLYNDAGSSGSRAWSTDAAGLAMGGRLQQPVFVRTPQGPRVIAPTAPPTAINDAGFSADFMIFDPRNAPGTAAFLVATVPGCGGGVMASDGNVYAIGAGGLFAFGPPPARTDVDADGRATIDDLRLWEQGGGVRDVDRSGGVNSADRERLIRELRLFERVSTTEGRR